MTLVYSAIAPVFVLMIWISSRDKLNPEPKRHVIRLFFLGMIIVAPAGWIERLLLLTHVRYAGPALFGTLFTAFFVAGIVEEFLKAAIFERGIYRHREFDEPIDGVIYGVAVSLGFAMVENVLYVTSYGLQVAFLRSVTAIPAHMMFGIAMGYYFSRAKMGLSSISTAYIVPAILHGIYDSFAMVGGLAGDIGLAFYLAYLVWSSFVRIKWLKQPLHF